MIRQKLRTPSVHRRLEAKSSDDPAKFKSSSTVVSAPTRHDIGATWGSRRVACTALGCLGEPRANRRTAEPPNDGNKFDEPEVLTAPIQGRQPRALTRKVRRAFDSSSLTNLGLRKTYHYDVGMAHVDKVLGRQRVRAGERQKRRRQQLARSPTSPSHYREDPSIHRTR